jgi:hypothetical protein
MLSISLLTIAFRYSLDTFSIIELFVSNSVAETGIADREKTAPKIRVNILF